MSDPQSAEEVNTALLMQQADQWKELRDTVATQAEQIASLNRQLDAAKVLLDINHKAYVERVASLAAAEAEVERLRHALDRIAKEGFTNQREQWMVEVAAAALSPTNPSGAQEE